MAVFPGGDLIKKEKVQFSGASNFKDLYEFMWGVIRHYDYSIHEDYYRQFIRGPVRDIYIKWTCVKPINSYILFKVELIFNWYVVRKVEVIEDGVKKEKDSAIYENIFMASIVPDWSGAWSKSEFLKSLRKTYDRYFYGRAEPLSRSFGSYKQWIIKLAGETNDFINEMKSFFNMYQL